MELTESRDRWLKTKSDYERFNNIEESSSTEERTQFVPELPASKSRKKNGLFLDLADSDGRWLIAAARKKFIPIGVSENVESASLSVVNLRLSKTPGYVVVADANELPFQQDLFDFIWARSPVEYNSLHQLPNLTENLRRVLAKSGITKIAWRKNYQQVSFTQVKKEFEKHLANVHCTINSKSRTVEWCSRRIQSLNHLSDSLYINARKNSGSPNFRIHHFLRHHWLKENLNIVYLLRCPISGGHVYLSKDSDFVISELANVKYPVVNDIPVMLKKAAIELHSNKTPMHATSRRL